MNHVIRISALLIALALIAYAPAQAASDTEGDWEGGWTSWKNAAKGDWAEYSSQSGYKVRWEVLDVTAGKIKYSWKTFDDKGTETQNKEKSADWTGIKLTYKLPYKTTVKWTVEELDLSGTKLTCDVATYTKGESTDQLFYCKDVPCGGFVKVIMNGKETNWLSAFGTAASGDVKRDPKDEPKVESGVKSQLPRFYGAVDNEAILKVSGTGRDATYQVRKVTEVAETSSKYTRVLCDAEGVPLPDAKAVDAEQTKADWDKVYRKPSETAVKLTVEAGEFVCDVFKSSVGGKETTEWISEGAPVKTVIKSGESETVMEAIKITMK
jgi:hypothetical protein